MTAVASFPGELVRKTTFADAGLAAEQDDPAVTGLGFKELALEFVKLPLTPDETAARLGLAHEVDLPHTFWRRKHTHHPFILLSCSSTVRAFPPCSRHLGTGTRHRHD